MIECDQLCLSSNQITVFFDTQYLWKESISIVDFLNGDNHQGKVVSKSTIFGWVWPVGPLVQSGFFDQQHLWMESINILDIFHGDDHQGKVASETAFS